MMTSDPIARATSSAPAVSTRSDEIQAILHKKIQDGARSAMSLIERIHADVPTDQLARASAIRFVPEGPRALTINVDGSPYIPTDHSLGQLAERAGVPALYLRSLLTAPAAKGAPEPAAAPLWRPELASHILATTYGHDSKRVLVRSVRGVLRGWQSDRYRRRDERRLVDTLALESAALGAIPIDGTATETRVSLKVIMPELIQPVPGEWMALGVDWTHSNFGNGANHLRAFALRVRCLNGMTGEDHMREVHIGARLSDDVEFSERTYRLDTEANVSAMRDVIRAALGPAARESLSARIRAASERAMTSDGLLGAIRALPKAQHKPIVDAFEGLDVVNLPPGETAWRASNAVSWIARHVEDAELALDMQTVAGKIAGAK